MANSTVQLSARARERVALIRVDQRYRTARTGLRVLFGGFAVWCLYHAIDSIAGKATAFQAAFTVGFSVLWDIRFVIAFSLAGITAAWAIAERWLRQRKVNYLHVGADDKRENQPKGSRMMMITTIMQGVIGLGSFVALLVILYGPWQEICTDVARQIVFEKRDAIFDLAHSGKLSFKSREYGIIRSSLQASIRFAHELTLPRFLVMAAGLRTQGSHPEDNEVSRAIRQISDPVTRNRVEVLVKEAYRALFLMMVAKSPVMLLLFVVGLLPGVIVLRYLPIPTRVKAIEPRARGYIQLEAEAA